MRLIRQKLLWWKLHNPDFNRFWLIHPCVGRQTDRRTGDSIQRALLTICRALKDSSVSFSCAVCAYMQRTQFGFGCENSNKPMTLTEGVEGHRLMRFVREETQEERNRLRHRGKRPSWLSWRHWRHVTSRRWPWYSSRWKSHDSLDWPAAWSSLIGYQWWDD